MSRSGNAPRTGCATADRLIVPDLVYRRLPPKGARRFRFSPNAFELAGPEPRPRADTITRRFRGKIFMETIRPNNTDPIPLRTSPHWMGTIMIRFVGLLVVAVVVLALAWSR